MDDKPTLVSLARDLGVSRQTVSNALNAPQRVNAVTLDRVLKGIKESGYRPNVAGRQLRTRRSRNLAMRLHPSSDGINGSVLDRFLHALTEAAQRDGYRLTLFTAADDTDEIAAIEELLATADIDGFVLTGTHHHDVRTTWLLEHDVAFVAFGRPWSGERDPFSVPHSWVDVDGGSGTAQATALLAAQGHHRIGFLGWPEGSGVGDDRRAGWSRAVREVGADADPQLLLGVEDSVADGARAGRELFDRGATALVCASDSLALGAIAAWRERNAVRSGGAPVTGFDDTPVALALGLTSVRQPVEAVAERVLALLLEQLDGGPGGGPHQELLPSALVVREPDPELSGARTPTTSTTHHHQ